MEPTSANIISKLFFEENDDCQETIKIYNFLKRFIRGSNYSIRFAFLWFCTRSDIVNRSVRVGLCNTSTSKNASVRSGISHTCAGLLELQSSYENFISFRPELNNILTSNI